MNIHELIAVQTLDEGPISDKVRNWMRPSYRKKGADGKIVAPSKSESPLTQLSNREAKSIFGKIIDRQELDSYELDTLKNIYRQL